MIAFRIICLVFMVLGGLGVFSDTSGRFGTLFFLAGLLFLGASIINLLA